MSTILDYGIPGVGSGILQPKLKHRWRVTFQGIGDNSTSQDLSLQLVTVTRPNITFEEVQLDRYVSRGYVASKYSWEPLQLSAEDDISGKATSVIQSQIQKQQFITGAEGPFLAAAPEGSQYKFTTIIDMLDGGQQVLEKWTVQGCWFSAVDYTDLDYAATDQVLINMTVRFDHAYQDPTGYVGSGSALRT